MPIRKNLRTKTYHQYGDMPGHRLAARTGKVTLGRLDRGADDDEGQHEQSARDDSAHPAHHFHEAITGTPLALPASSSNWAGSVVNSPSRMVLLVP
jgi:hypothetical protein